MPRWGAHPVDTRPACSSPRPRPVTGQFGRGRPTTRTAFQRCTTRRGRGRTTEAQAPTPGPAALNLPNPTRRPPKLNQTIIRGRRRKRISGAVVLFTTGDSEKILVRLCSTLKPFSQGCCRGARVESCPLAHLLPRSSHHTPLPLCTPPGHGDPGRSTSQRASGPPTGIATGWEEREGG